MGFVDTPRPNHTNRVGEVGATVSPTGSASDGPGPYGPLTPDTVTAGFQEAINYLVNIGGGILNVVNNGTQYLATSRIIFNHLVQVRGNNATIRHSGLNLNPFVTDISTVDFNAFISGLNTDLNAIHEMIVTPGTGPTTRYTNADTVPQVVRVTGGNVTAINLNEISITPTGFSGVFIVAPGKSIIVSWDVAPTISVLPVNWTLVSVQGGVLDLGAYNNPNGVLYLRTTNTSLSEHDSLRGKAYSSTEENLRGDTCTYGMVAGGIHSTAPVTNNAIKLYHFLRCRVGVITFTQFFDDNSHARVHGQVNTDRANGFVFNEYGGASADLGVYNNTFDICSIDVATGVHAGTGVSFNKNGSALVPKPNKIRLWFNGAPGEWTVQVAFSANEGIVADLASEVYDANTPAFWRGGIRSSIQGYPLFLFPPVSFLSVLGSVPQTIASLTIPWGPAIPRQVRVQGWVRITTIGNAAIQLQLSYTDEGGVSRKVVLPLVDQSGSKVVFTADAGGAPFCSLPITVCVKGTTAFKFATIGRFTDCCYNCGGSAEVLS